MIRVNWRSCEGLLIQLGNFEPMVWTHSTPAQGSRPRPKLEGCPGGSDRWVGRVGRMIRVPCQMDGLGGRFG